jgi:dTDP-4-dehydrorhamnose 3,5-epimerase
MRFTPSPIAGVEVIDLEPRHDERGFFARAFCTEEVGRHGLATTVSQANLVRSGRRGTVRGMHYQLPPHAEAKYVRCVRGAVFDVAVDLRRSSSTFGYWFGVHLDADNGRMLHIPPGVAHGYQTLEEDSETLYLTSVPYAPDAERGVRWNDPVFGIEWPIAVPILTSDKDAQWPDFLTLATSELPA